MDDYNMDLLKSANIYHIIHRLHLMHQWWIYDFGVTAIHFLRYPHLFGVSPQHYDGDIIDAVTMWL